MSAISSAHSTVGVNQPAIDLASDLARRVRIHALRMTSIGGGSHIGSAFSCADILSVLYSGVLNVDSANPRWPARDRFVMSKGHAGSALYAVLAETGFFSTSLLSTHYADASYLCGHVSHKGIPGVEISSGSLGHGLSLAAGMAYSAHLDTRPFRTFALLSDGECDEGSIWEAALFAGHHRLHRLIAIIDYNKIQSLASVADTLALEPFADKWKSFGWGVRDVNGHDYGALYDAFENVPVEEGKPTCIIAHTIKGKGVSFMENTVLWHYRIARGQEFDAALSELEGSR